jgi:hypothetical protein
MRLQTTLQARPEPFAATLLPLTMELARTVQPVLERELAKLPRAWPFEDRVLALLAPSLLTDLHRFHTSGGDDLSSLFATHQVEHLDRSLLGLLITRLARLSPETTAEVFRSASAPPEEANATAGGADPPSTVDPLRS